MSNELTDVCCPCGAEFQADSYDAGFIAGSGMCQNCDAALPPKDICTCPSGDGSLRHPCPAHIGPFDKLVGSPVHNESEPDLAPLDEHLAQVFETGMALSESVEQAGGDERDFQAKGAQEVPSPVSKEYDRHLIGLLRKGEALPGHQEEAADEIERLRDWNDHLNNTVLPNILNPNFLMLMKGGERLLDLCTKDGKFIGVSLNDMKDVFDWMVTHARIAPDHAALAQPSPASDLDPLNLAPHAEAFNEAPAEALMPGQAEAERPEVVAYVRTSLSGPFPELPFPRMGEIPHDFDFEKFRAEPLMTVAQHERIVGALTRDHAHVEEHLSQQIDILRINLAAKRDNLDAALARVAELTATRNRYGVDAHYFNKNLQLILRDFESFTPDELARSLIILAKVADEKVVAQAQHSVPEGVTIERDVAGTIHIKVGDFDFIQLQYQRPYTDNASTWKLAERIASLLAAAPSKEGL
ncbi:hypothetical protein [Pseudomonas aeruginosa]|uniref:hypothetical protein n=1 Tax=Pseudomonas aeruginosa TaxID=287 RepID=UPI003EE19543